MPWPPRTGRRWCPCPRSLVELVEELLEREAGPRAGVADHRRGGDRAELARTVEGHALRVAEQEAGRVEVAGAGGVDHPLDRVGRDLVLVVAGHDHRTRGSASQAGDLAVAPHAVPGLVERVDLVERGD